jgi:acyl-coenzyme A thioesterase PaaI-like protein
LLAALDQALRSVPMLATLGIRPEEARTGYLVLRLPWGESVTDHRGAVHTAAIFAVGELTAAVVLATHPALVELVQLQKSSRIKYYAPAHGEVTAHARVTPEMITAVSDGLDAGAAQIDVLVAIYDGHGTDVAELVSRFTFRRA